MNWKINYGWVVVDGVFKKDRHMKRKLKNDMANPS